VSTDSQVVSSQRPTARGRRLLLAGTALLAPLIALSASSALASVPHYTLAATESCLKNAGVPAAAAVNHSLRGSGGNLEVFVRTGSREVFKPSSYNVFVVFGRDAAEAFKIRKHAVDLTMQSFAAQSVTYTRHYVLDGVELTGNVFYYSSQGPLTKDERSKVDACLR
jgi:hypothetical protein